MRCILRSLREFQMESYRLGPGNPDLRTVAYDSYPNKKTKQAQTEPMVIFERFMVKTGLTAVTFSTINGAEKTLNILHSLVADDLIEPIKAIVVEKNKQGQLKVKKSINQTVKTPKCCELSFVVALLLRGSVANDLLGEASGTLLAHHIDLGIAQGEIDRIVDDIVAGSSVLFVQDYPNLNGVSPDVFSQINGRRYDLSLTARAYQSVQIMSSTLDHYWT